MKKRVHTLAMRLTALMLTLAMMPVAAHASTEAADSVARAPRGVPSELRWIPAVGGAAFALAAGASVHKNPSHINPYAAPADDKAWAAVPEFAPLAFPWIFKAAGGKTRSSWGQMAVSQAIGAGFLASVTYGIKHGVDERRPGSMEPRSFPSGHTAWAFFGATATAIELGDKSPWYAIGAYAVATGVAIERVVDKRHFPVDVIAGAGIGVVSAELGYYLGDVIFGGTPSAINDIKEAAGMSYLGIISELRWPIGRITVAPQTHIVRLPSLVAGVKGGFSITDNWGAALFVGLQSTPLQVASPAGSTYVASQNAVGFILSPYYQMRLNNRFTFNCEAGAGYFRNMNLKSIDRAVSCGAGSAVGRLTAGIVCNLTRTISVRAQVGYEIGNYDYSITPSAAYLTTAGGSDKGVRGAIVAGLSANVNF